MKKIQKPPVDIEWYDDGFSIEEQAELKYLYSKIRAANRPKIKVTEDYHEKTKDKIISELRQKLAANEEYIKELFSDIEKNPIVIELQSQITQEKEKRKNLQNEFSIIKKKYIDLSRDPSICIKKYKDTIDRLEIEIKSLRDTRDELISKLYIKEQNDQTILGR